jgi:hypothetical protein
LNRFTYSISIATILIGGLLACSNELSPEVMQDAPDNLLTEMLTDPCGKPTQVTLWARGTHDVGLVSVTNSENHISLEITAGENWFFARSQVAVARIPRDLPQTRCGNPRVGHFDLKTRHKPVVSEYVYEFDCAEDDFQPGDVVVFAVHAVLWRFADGHRVQRASAWAGRHDFPGRSRATFFYYTVQECPEPPDPPEPPEPPGSCIMEVIYPNGGELMQVGSTATLTWSCDEEACGTQVGIDLLYEGRFWLVIAESVPNWGAYEWEVNSGPVDGDGFTLRVTDLESGTFDESDMPFSIQVFNLP